MKKVYKCISINKPGPTDLTWEEENPVDYRYRPVDLPVVKKSRETKKGIAKKQKRNKNKKV